ncbi:Sugar transporter ERD6-like 5 [Linum perenne]
MGQLDYQQLETGFLRQPNDVAVTALVAVFGSMATGCAYGYSSPAESGVMAEMGMSVAQYSTFGSIMTIGGMLGSLVNGKMADLIGRRYDHTKLLEGLSENSVFDLFQQKYANALVVVSGLMVLQEFGGTNAIAYYAASICDMAGIYVFLQIPATVTSVLLTDKLGRRPLLLISSFGLFLSTFLLGLAFMFQDLHSSGTVTGLLAYIGLMGLPISFSLGMAGLPSVVMSEVFPINIKGTAGSLVTFLNWSSSFIVTYSFNFVVLWNSAGTFFIFSGIWVLGIMFIGKFVPETKGKTLEELTHIVSEEEEEEEG